MDNINEFIDERQRSWCIHCGEWIAQVESNRDHAPSKSFLKKPYPENLPVVQVCKKCNSSFSNDEEYFISLLGAVLTGTTESTAQFIPSARRILAANDKLRTRIERSKITCTTIGGEERIVWRPEVSRINNVVIKNARGYLFFEHGKPMLTSPANVWFMPLIALTNTEREAFERETDDDLALWPEVGSRMMTRLITEQDLSGDRGLLGNLSLAGRRLPDEPPFGLSEQRRGGCGRISFCSFEILAISLFSTKATPKN
jgi:hypothetical protein